MSRVEDMSTRYPDRNRYPTLTDEQFRDAFRPEQLPPPPWRYSITPSLVHILTRVADAAGQLRASPVSYYRQKELAARAKRERILWNVSGIHRGVTHEEVEAVLRGGRLVERRRAAGEAIERALVLEDALAHFTRFGTRNTRLTPEVAMAYHASSSGLQLPGIRRPAGNSFGTLPSWRLFSQREKEKLLDLQRESTPVPAEVKGLFAWADRDALVSESPVLHAATIYWGMTLVYPSWQSVSVLLHHSLRVGNVDANGLLMLSEDTEAQRELLHTPSHRMRHADDGDLTSYFEAFSRALLRVLWERLEELGRVRENESHLPWKVVAPPDELDARLYEVVERLGQAGSTAIVEMLGSKKPPLRTVQRRLQKLVNDGVLAKHGGRKNAVYTVPGRTVAD